MSLTAKHLAAKEKQSMSNVTTLVLALLFGG
jgi:hypothetical protein